MRQDRLLERMRKMEDNPESRGALNKSQMINSVLAYINRILNTRQGSVPIDDDFGIPDYSSLATRFSTESSDSIEDIELALKNVILKYEPRLNSVNVRFLEKNDQSLTLLFEISGKLVTDKGSESVVIRTVMNPDGEIKVTG